MTICDHLWTNHSVLFLKGEDALVSVIYMQASRVNEVMQYIVLQCLNYNILFVVYQELSDQWHDKCSEFYFNIRHTDRQHTHIQNVWHNTHIHHSSPIDDFLKIKMLSSGLYEQCSKYNIMYKKRRKNLILHIIQVISTRNNWDSKWHKIIFSLKMVTNEHVAHVQDAFLYKNYLLLHMYVNRIGLKLIGIYMYYTLIMQDSSKVQCSS